MEITFLPPSTIQSSEQFGECRRWFPAIHSPSCSGSCIVFLSEITFLPPSTIKASEQFGECRRWFAAINSPFFMWIIFVLKASFLSWPVLISYMLQLLHHCRRKWCWICAHQRHRSILMDQTQKRMEKKSSGFSLIKSPLHSPAFSLKITSSHMASRWFRTNFIFCNESVSWTDKKIFRKNRVFIRRKAGYISDWVTGGGGAVHIFVESTEALSRSWRKMTEESKSQQKGFLLRRLCIDPILIF